MSTLKNPFGMRDGHVIVIDDLNEVERGLACNCSCPMCGESFEARMGEERVHHFSHTKKSGCDAEEGVLAGLYLLLAEYLCTHTIEFPVAYIQAVYGYFKEETKKGIDAVTENDFDSIFTWDTIRTLPRDEAISEEKIIVYRTSTNAWNKLNGKVGFSEHDPYDECLAYDPALLINNKLKFYHEYEPGIGTAKALFIGNEYTNRTYIRIRLFRWCWSEKKYRDDSVQLPEGIPTLYIDIDEEILNPSPETSKIDTDTMLEHLLNPANMQWDSKSLPIVQVEKGKQALMKTFLLRRAREIIDEQKEIIEDQKKKVADLKTRVEQIISQNRSLQAENDNIKQEFYRCQEENNQLKKRLAPPVEQQASLTKAVFQQEQPQNPTENAFGNKPKNISENTTRNYVATVPHAPLIQSAIRTSSVQSPSNSLYAPPKVTESKESLEKTRMILKTEFPNAESIPPTSYERNGTRWFFCLHCKDWRTKSETIFFNPKSAIATKCKYCQQK